jgi:hypothetical protein
MLSAIFMISVLVAVTVAIHASGLTILWLGLQRWHARSAVRFWSIAPLLVGMAGCMIALHLAEILLWSFFYLRWGCLPDAESAFYYSGVTYTSIGYGDLVLAKPWRALAPIEGLIGILMCGLSSGVFFAFLVQTYQLRHGRASGRSTKESTEP